MAMMKAAVIHSAGGPEVLKIESLPIPQPRHDEVLIRVKAFGVRSDGCDPDCCLLDNLCRRVRRLHADAFSAAG